MTCNLDFELFANYDGSNTRILGAVDADNSLTLGSATGVSVTRIDAGAAVNFGVATVDELAIVPGLVDAKNNEIRTTGFIGLGPGTLPTTGLLRTAHGQVICTVRTNAGSNATFLSFGAVGTDVGNIGSTGIASWRLNCATSGAYDFRVNNATAAQIQSDRITGVNGAYILSLNGAQFGNVNLAGPTTRAITISTTNTWVNQPSGTNFYVGSASSDFSVNTTSGVLTYSGTSRQFLITGIVTIDKQGSSTQWIEVAVSKNSDITGTTNPVHSQATTIVAGADQCIVVRRVVTLANTDTVKLVFRNGGNADDLDLHLMTLTAEALSA